MDRDDLILGQHSYSEMLCEYRSRYTVSSLYKLTLSVDSGIWIAVMYRLHNYLIGY